MATFNKFDDFVEQLCLGKHNLAAAQDVVKVFLSNELPLATDTIKTDIAEITVENGYTPAGGKDITNDITVVTGTAQLTGNDVTWTASGGSFGPFQYVIIYNDTQTSPVDPLIGWWDYGSALLVLDGESFTVDFGLTVLTVA